MFERITESGSQDRVLRVGIVVGAVAFVAVCAVAVLEVSEEGGSAAPAATAPAAATTAAAPVAPPEPAKAEAPAPADALAIAHADGAEPVDHVEKAGALRELDDRKGFQHELRLALFHTPEDTSVLWLLARASDDDISTKAYERLVDLVPWDADPAREVARRRLDAGDAAGALAAASEAVKRDSRSWESYQLQGRALMAQKKLGAAIRAFKRATAIEGASAFAFNNLGYALLLAGKPQEAVDALEAALEKGPVTPYMLNNLGLAHEKLGNLDDAELAFQSAVDLRPDYVKAIVNLERVTETRMLADKEPQVAPPEEATPELQPGG